MSTTWFVTANGIFNASVIGRIYLEDAPHPDWAPGNKDVPATVKALHYERLPDRMAFVWAHEDADDLYEEIHKHLEAGDSLIDVVGLSQWLKDVKQSAADNADHADDDELTETPQDTTEGEAVLNPPGTTTKAKGKKQATDGATDTTDASSATDTTGSETTQ